MNAQGQFMVVMEAVGTNLLGTEKKKKNSVIFWFFGCGKRA